MFDVWDRTKLIPDVRQLFGGGRPDDRPKPLDQAGVPEAEGAVSSSDLASLSSTLTQIAAANAGTAQQPPNGSGRPI